VKKLRTRASARAGDWPFAIVPLVKISLDFFAEIL
jgi:hypothetical protein